MFMFIVLSGQHHYNTDNEPVWQRQQPRDIPPTTMNNAPLSMNGSVNDAMYGVDFDSGAQLEFFTQQQVNGESASILFV